MKHSFLKELLLRLLAFAPPKFFKILTIVAGILIVGIYILEWLVSTNQLPTISPLLVSGFVDLKGFLIGVFFSSLLPTTNPKIAETKK